MAGEEIVVEEKPVTPKQMRNIRTNDILDTAVGEAVGQVTGSNVALDIGELEKVLEFYYHPFVPDDVRKKIEKHYFAYMGTEIPTSNLNEQDSIWILTYLRDLQLLALKFGPLHGNIDDVAIANNLIVQTRANIQMAQGGFARKLDKSFQVGNLNESNEPPMQPKGGWRNKLFGSGR